jgi:hypothetical protein
MKNHTGEAPVDPQEERGLTIASPSSQVRRTAGPSIVANVQPSTSLVAGLAINGTQACDLSFASGPIRPELKDRTGYSGRIAPRCDVMRVYTSGRR